MTNDEVILKIRNVTKIFPGVIALNNVNFELKRGEVNAIIGENGAGKSTLIKIITGYCKRENGDVYLNDTPINLKNPYDGIKMGIVSIYQDTNLIPEVSIAENIFIGRNNYIFFNRERIIQKATKILYDLGFKLDLNAKVSSLNATECKIVEIVRAFSSDAKILILDEPTTFLPETKINMLFKLILSLKEKGISIIYISHILDEVFEIADRVTVLRDGENVGSLQAKEENRDKIINLMIGKSIDKFYPKEKIELGKEILKVNGLTKKGKFKDISFSLHSGEILGIFGITGSGNLEIAKSIYGSIIAEEGQIIVKGKKVNIDSPSKAISFGIGMVQGERKKESLILIHSVLKNLSLGNLNHYSKGGFIKRTLEKQRADYWVKDLNIKVSNLVSQIVNNLSGGNQQKVVLARILEGDTDILILNGPTVGIDIGTKTEVYKILENVCKRGKGIIIISEDIMEILSMSDRVIIIKEGKKTGEFFSKVATKEEVLKKAL